MSRATKKKNRWKANRRQDGKCLWCDVGMLKGSHAPPNHPQRLTAEHLVTKSEKGGDDAFNIVAACFKCNTDRANQPIEQWLPRVAFRLKKAGNPEHMEVILKHLASCGIRI